MKPRLLFLLAVLAIAPVACKKGRKSTPPPAAVPEQGAVAGDPSTPVDLADAYAGLYSGANPTQIGVAEGAIERARICLLHGTAVNEGGQPLAGVRVEVVDAPELGYTASDAEGRWTLVMNGGQEVEVRLSLPGRATSQRQVPAGWRAQYTLDPVVLVARSTTATPVTGGAPDSQVVLGDVSSDVDGQRRAMLFVPPGTAATAVLPDGQQQNLPVFTVRSTEYTVGDLGEQRMPAAYAGNIAYTYAIEYVCDEAEALGAKSVRFNKPVVHYLENFLDFPVGTQVPTGYFDTDRNAWVAANDGLVVRVLDVANGLAVLDLVGQGAPATQAQRQSLGISDDELRRLANVHGAGAELWRVRLEHFTPWDCNFPYGPPADAEPPSVPPPGRDGLFDADTEDQDTACGSIVLVQDRVLLEGIDIPGTGMRLVYRSDRSAGFRSRSRVVLSGDTLPPGLKRIEFRATIAGRLFAENFPPAPRLVHDLVWDGLDWRGQRLQGRQRADISIGYVYDATYQSPQQLQASFGQFSGVPLTGNRARREITLWQRARGLVGGFDAAGLGLGGWTLDAHHVYDAEARLLLRGDGTTEGRSRKGDVIDSFAGVAQQPGFAGEGGPAGQALTTAPSDVRIDAQGRVWFIEGVDWAGYGATVSALRRVELDGTITTVAGGTASGFAGDGGPATAAKLRAPHQFDFAPDGSIWISDTRNHCIRRIDRDGIIETVAGTPQQAGYSGDGGPATAAKMNWPIGIAVAPDGSCYFCDQNNNRIRRIGLDGTITTVLGTGAGSLTGDGGPAVAATVRDPDGLAVDRDGNIYFSSATQPTIRCIGIDGIVRRIAGTGQAGHSGDGGPATAARLDQPNGLQLALDGSILVAELGSHCIRRIAPDGTISTLAGLPGLAGFTGDGGNALAARMASPNAVAQAPDGTIYVAESLNHVIRRIAPSWPGFGIGEQVVVEADGTVLQVFDERGRHLRSESAMNQEVLVEHRYGEAGRLVEVRSASGTVTIERGADGAATGIVSPGGHRTSLQVGASGLLEGLTTPDGRPLQFTYGAGGLLTAMRFADGSQQTFEYDAEGRLVRDADATGRAMQLTSTREWDRDEVRVTTTAGRVQTYATRAGATPDEEVRTATTCCSTTETSRWSDGTTELRRQDGTVLRQTLRDDPVFGAEVRTPATTSITIPQPTGPALAMLVTFGSSATLADPNDPRSVLTRTTSTTIGTNTWTQQFDREAGTLRWTQPSGRTALATLDAALRITQLQVPGEAPMVMSYDGSGRLVGMSQSAGGVVRSSAFEYDADGNLVRMVDANGDVFTLTRDGNDRPLTMQVNGLAGPALAFDSAARLATLQPPGKPAHAFGRDAAGRLSSYSPPGGMPLQFQRDADGLVQTVDLAGEQTLGLVRDPGSSRVQGFVVGAPRVPGTIVFGYDAATGNLTTATTPEGVGITLTHVGSLPKTVQTTLPSVSAPAVTYTYDGRLRLLSLGVGSSSWLHQYDGDGLLVQAGTEVLVRDPASGNLVARSVQAVGVVHEFLLDGFGELDRIVASRSGTDLLRLDLARDLGGRIIRMLDPIAGRDTQVSYDARGRVRTVTVDGSPSHDLRYDDNGNPTTDVVTGRNFVVDGQDRLLQAGDVQFAYDAAGRLRSRTQAGQTTVYTYDVFGNLLRVQLPSGQTIDYLVDAFQHRCQRRVDGAITNSYVHGQNGRLLAESRNGTTWRTFVYGSLATVPDYMREGSTNYVFVHDHLGSVRRVVNASTGAVVQAIDYDVFGNVLTDSNPGFQPFGFAGGLHDPATGLTRFGARDYSPEMQRWTSRDPSLFGGGTTNLYEYCHGDPVNRIDPTGHFAFFVVFAPEIITGIGAGIGALGAGAVQVAANYYHGVPLSDGLMGAVAGGAVAGGISIWAAPLAGSTALAIGSGATGLLATGIAAGYTGAANAVGQVVNNLVEGNCWDEGVTGAFGWGAVGYGVTSTIPSWAHKGFQRMDTPGLRPSSWKGFTGQRAKAGNNPAQRLARKNRIIDYYAGNLVAATIGSFGSFDSED